MTLADVLVEIEARGAQAEYQREQSVDDREHCYWDGRVAAMRDMRTFLEIAALRGARAA